MRSRHLSQAFAGLLALGLTAPAIATVTQSVPCATGVPCHELDIDVALPGHHAELSLRFEQVQGLTASSFVITAQEVDPDTPVLTTRIPSGVFINSQLPLRLDIERADGSNLTFHGMWTLQLHSDNIDFQGEPTARLFRNDDDTVAAGLEDVTNGIGIGSSQVAGSSGDFGTFLIVSDMRPPIQIAVGKYQRLQLAITGAPAGEIDPAVAANLIATLQRSRDAFLANQRRAAVELLDQLVQLAGGSGVADLWDPALHKTSRSGIVRGLATATRLAVEQALQSQSQATASFVRKLSTSGGHQLSVIVRFPDQVGDLTDSLDFSATDVNPSDPALIARLPKGVTIPKTFPVLVHVGPATTAVTRPTFRGPWEIELVTRQLDFTANSTLRLFKAPDHSGKFVDVTSSLGVDSMRAGAASGDFSEFLLVNDTRSLSQVTGEKFDLLTAQLNAFGPQIDPTLLDQLRAKLAEARSFSGSKKTLRKSIAALDELATLIEENSGTGIPDLFRRGDSSRSNAAGLIAGGVRSAQLTMTLRLTGK